MGRWAVLVLPVILAGCAGPPLPGPPEPGAVKVTVLAAFPRGDTLRWQVEVQNGLSRNLTPAHLHLDVLYYGKRDAGHDNATVDVPTNGSAIVPMDGVFFGAGDYTYTVTATDVQGRELARDSQLYELCFC